MKAGGLSVVIGLLTVGFATLPWGLVLLVGLTVTGLKRVRIGRVRLGQLPAGQWRYLGEHEAF